MTVINAYATLEDFKKWKEIQGTDVQRDADVELILEASSRYMDDVMGRTFYPRVETRSYNVPEGRALKLDDDLLEVITLTNGDDTTIASTEYNLVPKNFYPKYEIDIKPTSTSYWRLDSNTNSEFVLDVNGVWGFHDRYSTSAWKSAGTLGAAISDTSTLTVTMTAGHTVTTGRIYKVDNELFIPNSISTNTLTLYQRGQNGSTAATHLINAVVYEWRPMKEIVKFCLEKARYDYARRFGESPAFGATVTAAGVVLSPREMSKAEEELKMLFRRKY